MITVINLHISSWTLNQLLFCQPSFQKSMPFCWLWSFPLPSVQRSNFLNCHSKPFTVDSPSTFSAQFLLLSSSGTYHALAWPNMYFYVCSRCAHVPSGWIAFTLPTPFSGFLRIEPWEHKVFITLKHYASPSFLLIQGLILQVLAGGQIDALRHLIKLAFRP